MNRSFIVLDGAMGTSIQKKLIHEGERAEGGVDLGPWWGAQLVTHNPKTVSDVHESFLCAGSSAVLTCTYQVHDIAPVTFQHDTRMMSLRFSSETVRITCAAAARLARESVDKAASILARSSLRVFGSIGPIGSAIPGAHEFSGAYTDMVTQDSIAAFYATKLSSLAHDSHVDAILFETFPRLDEAVLVLRYYEGTTPAANRKPCAVSFVTHDGVRLPCGALIIEIVPSLLEFIIRGTVVAVGFNCSSPASCLSAAKTLLEYRCSEFSDHKRIALWWKPNVFPECADVCPDQLAPSSDFTSASSQIMQTIASICRCGTMMDASSRSGLFDKIWCGGCCGTTAGHVAWLHAECRRLLTFDGEKN